MFCNKSFHITFLYWVGLVEKSNFREQLRNAELLLPDIFDYFPTFFCGAVVVDIYPATFERTLQ